MQIFLDKQRVYKACLRRIRYLSFSNESYFYLFSNLTINKDKSDLIFVLYSFLLRLDFFEKKILSFFVVSWKLWNSFWWNQCAGFILVLPLFNQIEGENLFDDELHWEVPEISEDDSILRPKPLEMLSTQVIRRHTNSYSQDQGTGGTKVTSEDVNNTSVKF